MVCSNIFMKTFADKNKKMVNNGKVPMLISRGGNMKRTFMAFLIAILLVSSSNIVNAASPTLAPKVLVNGLEITFPNKPIVVNGTTMVPFRNLLESLNARVEYNTDTRTITTSANNTTIQLVLGEKVAVKNGQILQLTQAPYVKNNVTYVPLRVLSQSFGYAVDYKNNTVYINTGTSTISQSSDNKPTLTVQEIGKLTDRVAYIELYNSKGKLFASGSGVVVDSNGGILTNYHVIQGATKAIVYIGSEKYETQTILKQDERRDLALIKINKSNLPYVSIGKSSSIDLGESVVTLGSPLGFSNTLSTGVISNVDRLGYIQFTAPIDSGSSGGALFNMKGELIGITTALVSSSANINFAIPSDDVTKFLKTASEPFDMVGVTKSGEDRAVALQNIDLIKSLLNDYFYSFYNEEIEFDVYWFVSFDEEKEEYKLTGCLDDYGQYVDLVKYFSREPSEMGDLYFMLFDALEEELNLKNIFIYFIVLSSTTDAPNPSYIDSKHVHYEDGEYGFVYYFSHAVREGNTIQYVPHYLINNELTFMPMN